MQGGNSSTATMRPRCLFNAICNASGEQGCDRIEPSLICTAGHFHGRGSHLWVFTGHFHGHGRHLWVFTGRFHRRGRHLWVFTGRFHRRGRHLWVFTGRFHGRGRHLWVFTGRFHGRGGTCRFSQVAFRCENSLLRCSEPARDVLGVVWIMLSAGAAGGGERFGDLARMGCGGRLRRGRPKAANRRGGR